MTPKQAITEYINALIEAGANPGDTQFRVDNGLIYLGHSFGFGVDDVQWAMRGLTPEQLSKAAKMRRLNLGVGDPRKAG